MENEKLKALADALESANWRIVCLKPTNAREGGFELLIEPSKLESIQKSIKEE